jgi:tripartite-type tricarboxylate transporter receptor subunit TctC
MTSLARQTIPAVLATLCIAPNADAQPYPEKAVRWIVPAASGTRTDVLARVLARQLASEWGIEVIADNRPGGGGVMGVGATVSAIPDGYTIVLAQAMNIAIAPAVHPALPYDPLADLQPVTQVAATPHIIVVHPSLPAKNVANLIAFARAKPGVITYGSPGTGSVAHLAIEMLKSMARIDMTHAPGDSVPLKHVLDGDVFLYAGTLPPLLAHIDAGRLRALAVTSAKPLNALANVPTVAAGGVPDYEAVDWFAVFAPPGTSAEIVRKLHAGLGRILAAAGVKQSFAADGSEVVRSTPEELHAYVRSEIARWTRAARHAGLSAQR